MKVVAKLEIGMGNTLDFDDLILTFEKILPDEFVNGIKNMNHLDGFVVTDFEFSCDDIPIVNTFQSGFYYCHKEYLFELIDNLIDKCYTLISVERVIKGGF